MRDVNSLGRLILFTSLLLSFSVARGQLPPPVAPPTINAAPPQAKPEDKPADTIWACKVLWPEGTAPEAMNVGLRFVLDCEGPSIALDREKLALDLPKAQRYALRILGVKSLTETRGEFIATSWQSGELKISNPILTDGVKRVSLGEIKLQITSVIDPQENPESKPFPPWGAMKFGWPIWLWGIFAAFAAVFIGLVSVMITRNLRRKRLLRLLEKNQSALDPYTRFNADLRQLIRHLPLSNEWSPVQADTFLKDLDQHLRWYVARVLVIQPFNRALGRILDEIKRTRPRVFEASQRHLGMVLNEIEKARAATGSVSVQDAHQLTDLARAAVDSIHGALGKGK